MGALFGKLPDGDKAFAADLANVDPTDANFYVIIRQTIQGLDTLILNVTLQGSTFLFVFLGVAGWLFEKKLCLPIGPDINLAPHGSWIIAGGALVLAFSLYRQLIRFVGLQVKAIDIAKRVESALLAKEFRLTHEFETVPYSGGEGKRLFQFFFLGVLVVSAAAFMFFLIAGTAPYLQSSSESQRGIACKQENLAK